MGLEFTKTQLYRRLVEIDQETGRLRFLLGLRQCHRRLRHLLGDGGGGGLGSLGGLAVPTKAVATVEVFVIVVRRVCTSMGEAEDLLGDLVWVLFVPGRE